RRYEPQRLEAVNRRCAKRIRAADDGRVAEACFDHAGRIAESLGRRGTSGGSDHRRAAHLEEPLHQPAERIDIVGLGVTEIGGQWVADRDAAAISALAVLDARGAGAEENADA